MFLTRNGYFEETFFTFSQSPIRDESGGIGGLFHPVTETTATMLSERRTRALRDLTTGLGTAADVSTLVSVTIDTLAGFAFDLPFVLLYERADEGYRLIGSTGIAAGTPASPIATAPESTSPWPFADATDRAEMIEVADAGALLGDLACGPYEESPTRAFVMPISAPGTMRARSA